MQTNPLNKVVFIQKVASFTKTKSPLKDLFRLAYVNNSWNDTIKNYSFHLFEEMTRDIQDTKILENVCGRVIKCDVIWFVEVLMSSKSLQDRVNLPLLVCRDSSSLLQMMQVALKKIVEIGGKDMLKSQLMVASSGNCVLFLILCCNKFSAPEVMNLIFDKIIEVGGKDMLANQLSAKDYSGRNCLMLCCRFASCPEIVKVVFEKIVSVGGKDLLRSHVTATTSDGYNCLRCTFNSTSPEVVKLVFDKIVEAGGTAMLTRQLTIADNLGRTALMKCCSNCSSLEIAKVVFEKIVEVGGVELLRKQLVAFDDDEGKNCLMYCCDWNSFEVIRFLAVVLFELKLFKEQYWQLEDEATEELREKANIKDAFWVPDSDSIAEVKNMLKR